MVTMIKRSIIFACIVCCGLQSQAQRRNTFENWFSAAAKIELAKPLDLTIEEAYRIREMFMSRQNYTDISLEYQVSKFFSVTGGYRLALKNSMFNIEEVNHRVYLELSETVEAGDFDFSLRTRVQNTSGGQEDDLQLPTETYFRNRLKAKYKFSKEFSMSAAYEFMLVIVPGSTLINENRYSIEAGYRFNKHNSLSVGYILRNYIQVEDPLNVNVISLEYAYKF